MKTISINLYQFNELSKEAKQKVMDNWQYDDAWQADRQKSYDKAKELYALFETEGEISGARLYAFIQNNILPQLKRRIKYVKADLPKGYHKYASSKIYPDEKARFSRIEYSEDASNLTGYCSDYAFLEPIFDFLKNPTDGTTNEDLLNTDLDSIYEKESQSDYNDFFEEANFAENCEANEYTFEENGKMRNA